MTLFLEKKRTNNLHLLTFFITLYLHIHKEDVLFVHSMEQTIGHSKN